MSNTEQYLSRKELNDMTRDAVRAKAYSLKISKPKSFNKLQLIDLNFRKQDKSKPKLNAVELATRSAAAQQSLSRLSDSISLPVDLNLPGLELKTRFHGKIQTLTYTPKENQSLPNLIEQLYPYLLSLVREDNTYKISIDLKASFESAKFHEATFYIQSKRYASFEENKMLKILNDLQAGIENKDTQSSGWRINSIDEVFLNSSIYKPLKGSCYVELPEFITRKNAVLNIHNSTDQQCFLFSVLAALYPASSCKENPNSYSKHMSKLNISMLTFPQRVDSSILKFEKANNLIINVYTCEKELIVPLRVSPQIDKIYLPFLQSIKDLAITSENIGSFTDSLKSLNSHDRLVNLFLYSNHYSLITDLHKLISKQVSSDHSHNFICYRCLNSCKSALKYFHHLRFCVGNDASQALTILPEPNTFLSFKRFETQQKLPFAIYYDFETCFQNSVHVPVAVSYKITSSFQLTEDIQTLHTIVGDSPTDNVAKKFVKSLIFNIITSPDSLYNRYFKKNKRFNVPGVSTEQKMQPSCHICERPFQASEKKVIDHDHFTGDFRGMAHKACNLKCKEPTFIPVIAHNCSKYDIHLFIKELSEIQDNNLSVTYLPSNSETFISISLKYKVGEYEKENKTYSKYFELRFLDSLRFMQSSLDNLTRNLSAHPHLDEVFTDNELLRCKGIFPYEYLNSFDVLKEPKLPPIESFYSSLRLESVSEEEYSHANHVFDYYKCETLKDYLILYLKTDVLHLADVFEEFRNTCLDHYTGSTPYGSTHHHPWLGMQCSRKQRSP